MKVDFIGADPALGWDRRPCPHGRSLLVVYLLWWRLVL